MRFPSPPRQAQLRVAIVGRPNVGKSTLFNRLVGHRSSVVAPVRGTTRDRLYGQAVWRGRPLSVIDSGGYESAKQEGVAAAVQRQVRRAVEDADVLLFVCDGLEGLVPQDHMVLDALRATGKPIVLAVNKLDEGRPIPAEFHAMGLSPVIGISALHGRGVGDLLDRILETAPAPASTPSPAPAARPTDAAVAIIGRPNVGKSSLFNALLREDRAIVSEIPGTTRDAVDTWLDLQGRPLVLIDTAGLRHRRKVKTPVDFFSMARTIEAIQRCDAALVVLDATQGVTRDDLRIVSRVIDEGCGLVLAVNKWDLMPSQQAGELPDAVGRAIPYAAFAPVVAVSAKTGFHVVHALREALDLVDRMRGGLPEDELSLLIQDAWRAKPPPRWRGRLLKLLKVRWVRGRPIRIELDTAPVARIPAPYQHYLLKRLHADPRLRGLPLAIVSAEPQTPERRDARLRGRHGAARRGRR